MKNILKISVVIFAAIWLLGKCSGCADDFSSSNVCVDCGEKYSPDVKVYSTYYNEYVYPSRERCVSCEAKYSEERNKQWMKQEIKKARNKWVDDNPQEARRRGISKF